MGYANPAWCSVCRWPLPDNHQRSLLLTIDVVEFLEIGFVGDRERRADLLATDEQPVHLDHAFEFLVVVDLDGFADLVLEDERRFVAVAEFSPDTSRCRAHHTANKDSDRRENVAERTLPAMKWSAASYGILQIASTDLPSHLVRDRAFAFPFPVLDQGPGLLATALRAVGIPSGHLMDLNFS